METYEIVILSPLIIFFVLLILIVTISFIAAYQENSEEYLGYNEVPCFDRHNNKIIGQICKDKVYTCGWAQDILSICEKDAFVQYPVSGYRK